MIKNSINFSAAKAPYRATFRVQTVGIEQVERCADPNYELIQDFSNQYSQMAIFKVGDDVRQVKNKKKQFKRFSNFDSFLGYFGFTINASFSKYIRTRRFRIIFIYLSCYCYKSGCKYLIKNKINE